MPNYLLRYCVNLYRWIILYTRDSNTLDIHNNYKRHSLERKPPLALTQLRWALHSVLTELVAEFSPMLVSRNDENYTKTPECRTRARSTPKSNHLLLVRIPPFKNFINNSHTKSLKISQKFCWQFIQLTCLQTDRETDRQRQKRNFLGDSNKTELQLER